MAKIHKRFNLESSGDFASDVTLALALSEITDTTKKEPIWAAAFRHAMGFAHAASDISIAGRLTGPPEAIDQSRLAPFCANSGFACELYLKAIALMHGMKAHSGHELLKLYEKLPDQAKTDIAEEGAVQAEFLKISKWDIKQFLTVMNRFFELWRYAFEKDTWLPVAAPQCIFMCRALHGAGLRQLNRLEAKLRPINTGLPDPSLYSRSSKPLDPKS